MITFEVARTGLDYVEVSWNARFGSFEEPIYLLVGECLGSLEPVQSVEVLKFSAHLVVPTPTDEVLESIKAALEDSAELAELLAEPYEVQLL